MGRGYVVVEGHGDVEAVPILLRRLATDLRLPPLEWVPLRCGPLIGDVRIRQACATLRRQRDSQAAMVFQDADDECPRLTAPAMAALIRSERLPFPVAVLLAHPEYEVFFLPGLHLLAGRQLVDERGVSRSGLRRDARFDGDPQARRDAKGLLNSCFPPGRAYKETLDQAAFTRMLDFSTLRAAALPCFGTLERAMRFLVAGGSGDVYPAPLVSPATLDQRAAAGGEPRKPRRRKGRRR